MHADHACLHYEHWQLVVVVVVAAAAAAAAAAVAAHPLYLFEKKSDTDWVDL